jgi:hypothetical protein
VPEENVVPTNLIEINGKALKELFVSILQRHSLGQPMYYWFFPETYQAVPGHSVPCYKAYVGIRANLLDPMSMIWFVNVLRFDAPEVEIDKNMGEAMEYLRTTRAKYLASINGQGNPGNGGASGLWTPGS